MTASLQSALTSLQPLIAPHSIAVVGASENPGAGRQVLENLNRLGFGGRVYPVNPRYRNVLGTACYPSLTALGESGVTVEMVAVLLGRDQVVGALDEAGRIGARAAWVLANGFAEADAEGRKLQTRLTEVCRHYGVRLCGPNCVGILNLNGHAGCYSVPAPREIRPGTIGVLAQSGYIAMQVANSARDLGLSIVISAGNEADLDATDYLDYLIEDPGTRVIAAFIEQFRRPERLPPLALKARRAGKPIVLIKVGRSEMAQRATSAHTGALAGPDDVQDCLFRKLGLVRVDDLDEMFETAELLNRLDGRLPRGDGIFATTLSGGVIGLLGDLGEPLALRFPRWSDEGRRRVREVLPPFAAVDNPLDAWGYGRVEETYLTCLRAVADEPESDLILVSQDVPGNMAPGQVAQYDAVAHAAADVYRSTDKPVVFLSNPSGGIDPDIRRTLERAGVPLLQGGREGLKAIRHLIDYAEFVRAPFPEETVDGGRGRTASPARDPGGLRELLGSAAGGLTEYDSKRVLAAYGIRCTREKLCASAREAVAAAHAIGGPVALKVMSPQILHKTEAGVIALGIEGEQAVRRAYRRVLAAAKACRPDATVQGVLCQEMVEGAVAEVIVGVLMDPQFGPAVIFGSGGILVEVLGDRSIGIPPLRPAEARAMIERTKGGRLLKGFRGKPPGDIEALAHLLVAVGDLAVRWRDRLEALDINPVMVLPEGQGVAAADALVILKNPESATGGARS